MDYKGKIWSFSKIIKIHQIMQDFAKHNHIVASAGMLLGDILISWVTSDPIDCNVRKLVISLYSLNMPKYVSIS